MLSLFVRPAVVLPALWLLVLMLPPTVCADDSDVAKSIAAAIIRQATIKCLAEREFPFKEATFRGTAKAVEPEKRVEVEIVDFLYVPGRVVVAYNLTARFHFAGTVTTGESEQQLTATADVSAEVDLTANYREENGSFVLDAKIVDLDDFQVKVLELDPADLPGGKELVGEHAQKSLAEHSDVLIREVDAWLKRNNRY